MAWSFTSGSFLHPTVSGIYHAKPPIPALTLALCFKERASHVNIPIFGHKYEMQKGIQMSDARIHLTGTLLFRTQLGITEYRGYKHKPGSTDQEICSFCCKKLQ